jgi:UDPglucose 6-dehydrogenase
MRESSAITIINDLTRAGATITAYDPRAVQDAKERYLKDNAAVSYCTSKYDALTGADALILVTEWKEFRSPDFYEIKKRLKSAVIFDGRNQYDSKKLAENEFTYIQIGVQND